MLGPHGGRETHFARGARLRSNNRAQSVVDARCARHPQALRSSTPPTGGEHQSRLAAHRLQRPRASTRPRSKTCPSRRCEASRAVLPVCGAEERSVLGSEPYLGDFPALSEACTRAEFAGKPPQYVSTAGNPSVPRGAPYSGRPFFAYFLSAKRKKVSRPPGRNPGLPTQETMKKTMGPL